MTELLNCPFCGGEAGKVFFLKGHTPASIGDTQHSETCPLAFSWSGFYRPTPEEAIAAWNTRASDAERREPDANENPYSRARLNSENTKLRAEITRLTEALRAAEEREKGLLSALEEWMFRYFWRVDGMPVEAARIHAQSRMKIAALVGGKP